MQMESLRLRLTAMQFLEELQGDTDTEWILSDLDVDVCFGLSRATRMNAKTRAKQAGLFTQIQDAMNR